MLPRPLVLPLRRAYDTSTGTVANGDTVSTTITDNIIATIAIAVTTTIFGSISVTNGDADTVGVTVTDTVTDTVAVTATISAAILNYGYC